RRPYPRRCRHRPPRRPHRRRGAGRRRHGGPAAGDDPRQRRRALAARRDPGRSRDRDRPRSCAGILVRRRSGAADHRPRARRTPMKIVRRGTAVWQGGLKDGRGAISTESGALKDHPYGFAARFEGTPGTNPEELLGAAHAGCFTMALSLILGEAGLTAERMETKAEVSLVQDEGGFSIPAVHLTLEATGPGTDAQAFTALAEKAKAGCPVSKLFKAEITLDVSLTD